MKRSKVGQILVALMAIMFVFSTSALAEVVTGRVVNAETGEPLVNAFAKELISYPEGGSYETYVETDSIGRFYLDAPKEGRLLVTFSMIGFKISRKVNYVYGSESKDTLNLGTIKLHPTALMLQEVEVKAKLPRVTMKGDTIVFNPSAFKLQDGDRLAELISKLPGVTRKDGKLTWNGKTIRLVVNGKDMFGGDEILTQLPVAVADKIKLYDRKSELARHTGKDDGDEDQVLDIQIKPGFMDKWYGSIEGKYAPKDYYNGKLQAYKLSDNNPQVVYGQANNMNMLVDRENGYWINSSVDKFGKSQFGAYDFQHEWSTKDAGAFSKNHFNIGASLGHADGWGTEDSMMETFFPNADQTLTEMSDSHNSHSLKPKVDMGLFAYTDKNNSVKVNVTLSYEKQRLADEQAMSKYVNNDMVTRSRYYTSTERELRKMMAKYVWNHYIGKKGVFSLSGETEVTGGENESHINRTMDYLREGLTETMRQWEESPERRLATLLRAKLGYWFGKKVYMSIDDEMEYVRRHDHRDMYSGDNDNNTGSDRPSIQDRDNRKDFLLHRFTNTANLSLMLQLSKNFNVTPAASWQYVRDDGDLRYGSLDTTAVRTANIFTPSLKMKWKINRARNMEMSFVYDTTQPSLYDTFGWRDTTDPMFVSTGNADLKSSHSYSASYRYTRLWLRQQITLQLSASYKKTIDPIATLYSYNSATGAYCSMPLNVKGGEIYTFGALYDQGIGLLFRVKNIVNYSREYGYGYLTQVDGDQGLRLNRQSINSVEDDFKFSYETEKVRVSLFNNLKWYRYCYSDGAYNMSPFSTSFGADVYVVANPFRFSARIWDEFRSGYQSTEMNRHRLMSNASVSYMFMKNKCMLSLRANDIFNQARMFSSEFSAYERREKWSESFHHYVMLSFEYNFDAKVKK